MFAEVPLPCKQELEERVSTASPIYHWQLRRGIQEPTYGTEDRNSATNRDGVLEFRPTTQQSRQLAAEFTEVLQNKK